MAEFSSLPAPAKYIIFAVSGIGPLWFIQLLWLYSLILLGLRKLDSKDRFYNVCGNIFSTRIGVAMLLLIFFFLSCVGWKSDSYGN